MSPAVLIGLPTEPVPLVIDHSFPLGQCLPQYPSSAPPPPDKEEMNPISLLFRFSFCVC